MSMPLPLAVSADRTANRAVALKAVFYLGVPIFIGAMMGANHAGIAQFMEWPVAIGYWILQSLSMWLAFEAGSWLVYRIAGANRLPLWSILIGGVFLGSLIWRPFVYWFTGLFEPLLLEGRTVGAYEPLTLSTAFMAEYVQNWVAAYLVWVTVNYLFVYFVGMERFGVRAKVLTTGRTVSDGGLSAPPAIGPAFLTRLPAHIGQDIIALKAEDHYVRVTTTSGEALVLYRFTDAIKDMPAQLGQRVHRSYWVSAAHIQDIQKFDRRYEITLSNGQSVPASATYSRDLFLQRAGKA